MRFQPTDFGSSGSGFWATCSSAARIGISAKFTILVPLMYFHSKNAAITSGISRYDDTKLVVDQPPFVNTENPPVNRIVMHMNSASGDEYGVQLL